MSVEERLSSVQTDVGRPRVMLVDDDKLILSECAELLGFSGITCLKESEPARAIERVQAEPDIELVVTDFRMPGTSGPELITRLRNLLPEERSLRFMLLSGFEERLAPEFEGVVQLLKPVDFSVFVSAIRDALEQ